MLSAPMKEPPRTGGFFASSASQAGDSELHDVGRDLSGTLSLVGPDAEGSLEDER
jgi:hypothetical protein